MFTTQDSNTAMWLGECDDDDDDDNDNDDDSGVQIGSCCSFSAGGGVCTVHTGINLSLAAFNTRVAAVKRSLPTAAAIDCVAARAALPAETNVFILFAVHMAARDKGAASSA
jgi:hypothetical protein